MNDKDNNNGQDAGFRKRALEYLISPDKLFVLFITVPIKYIFLYLGLAILFISFLLWSFFGSLPVFVEGLGIAVRSDGLWSLSAPEKGKIKEVWVGKGDIVEKDALIALIENTAAKTEREVRNAVRGRAYEILISKGDFVELGEPLIKLEGTKEVIFLGFFQLSHATGLKVDLPVKISLINASDKVISGRIKEIYPYLVSPGGIELIISNKGTADFLAQGYSTLIQVSIDIEDIDNVESGSIGIIKGISARIGFYEWIKALIY